MMRDKRAEFNIQGMIISLLVVGLFFGIFGTIIATTHYDITGYDEDEISKYNKVQNLSATLQDQYEEVDKVKADSSWFDFFSGMWSKLLAPFQFIYRTFGYLTTMFNQVTDTFQLLPVFKQFFSSVILVLVVVGIVLIKFGLGRKK